MQSNTLPTNIGIWGFGKTGKSALAFLASRGTRCAIFDNRALSDDERVLIQTYGGTLSNQSVEQFLADHPHVLASPGVNTTPYRHLTSFINELDLFYAHWNKPIIAITGSIGKTTTTTLAHRLLQQFAPCVVGGNIGTAMLDLLQPEIGNAAYALLELSSWQLEHTQQFRPKISIWTNLYPNHLDRHGTMEAYARAKAQMLRNQTADDSIIAHIDLQNIINQHARTQQICYIAPQPLSAAEQAALPPTTSVMYATDSMIMHYQNGRETEIMLREQLPKHGFLEHWLTLIALCKQMHLHVCANHLAAAATIVEHRLEPVISSYPGIYINDSKSTTPASTFAAVDHYSAYPIYLLLGGLSKGVDRSVMMAQLQKKGIKEIVCFGKEATQLAGWATEHGHRASAHATLDAVMAYIFARVTAGDAVLLSPAGSSYDLYRDYEERGKHFKNLCAG
jgi:UDP-N-acetylmuramoylalanine--D-glutamate ligase